MKKGIFVLVVCSMALMLACTDDNIDGADHSPPNILLIIADDLGKDALNGFSEGSIKPNTPNLDSIRNSGLSFSNFWSSPTCSPTRATILTGKYGYRTGVKWAGDLLNPSEKSLQKYINEETDNNYATAVVGKWHLSGSDISTNPESFGIDYYSGLIRGEAQSYYNWQLAEDAQGSLETQYSTTKFTDLAIDWIEDQNQPWFMWLAYNAPHTPFHAPPSAMHSQGNLPNYEEGMDPMPYYMAAIEAMDYQIGRLMQNLTPAEKDNTVIIFMADNGTPTEVAQLPYTNGTSKGSLYQGGINVPMFISGKGVGRTGIADNLVLSTDMFATIAAIAGASVTEIHDSRSFSLSLSQEHTSRAYQYAELTNSNAEKWVISNGNYKLHENANGNQELYNLQSDPYEQVDLLEQTDPMQWQDVLNDLLTELSNIRQ